MQQPYDEEYYLDGKRSGKSLYENYRWLPELTHPMVKAICAHVGIKPEDTVLDFGCARGYTVRAFREQGYKAFGVDISEWAINHCDPAVAAFVTQGDMPGDAYDWIIAKDVLEHVPLTQIANTIVGLLRAARRGVFVVVPLAEKIIFIGGPKMHYVVPEYELDVTHQIRSTLIEWAELFLAVPEFAIRAEYRVQGVKDNYARYAKGNGFITAYRIAK